MKIKLSELRQLIREAILSENMDVKAFWNKLPKKEGDLRDAKDVLSDAIGSRKEEIKKYYELKDKVDELKNEYKTKVDELKNEYKTKVDELKNEYKTKVDELKNEHERLKTAILPVLSLVQIRQNVPSLEELDSILRDAVSREELFKLIDEYKEDLERFRAIEDEQAGRLSESHKNKKR